MHLRFSRPFQRFLSLALADRPEPQGMEDALRGTVQLADYSDVAPPHQNPNFGLRIQLTAAATLFGGVVILANTRALRIRHLFVPLGSAVRIRVFTLATNPMTVITATVAGESMGPRGDDVSTATVRTGTAPAGAAPIINGFLPEEIQWSVRPPFLIAPGQVFAAFDTTAATTMALGCIWEELPRFGEVANAGYPGPND